MEQLALAAAGPVVDGLVKKLGSTIWKELGLLRTVRTDVTKLQSVLSTIKAVLDDAERRSITNREVSDWLRKLRDAALDAEDVMEEFETEALRRRMERTHDRIAGKVRDFYSSNNPIAFRYKMARKIKDIRERLDDIAEERLKFHLAEGSASERVVDRETISFVNEPEVYGRVDDREEVIDFLVSTNNEEDVSVLPIVGLGGVGKTTLAQYVYNDERLNGRFDLKVWVCVSETFNIHRIMRAVIENVTNKKCEFSELQSMRHQLETELSGKVFLLVLDDIWNESDVEWERLKALLRVGKKCKIITTTRSDRVAEIMGTVTPKKLQCLDEDDCWTLFKQSAFGNEAEEENLRLVEIGKEIVQKCKGLPLAAKALGSLMRFKREEDEWLAIKNDEIWKLPMDNKFGILPILKLSYDHLPSHLKRCFTYCSMFPKDYEFKIKSLIQLWMAEGLIDAPDTSLHAEDIGMQYFNNLLQRSFFQDIEMDEYNNMDRCKMHDLVHDLACSLTKDESWFIEKGRENIPSGCRYLSIDVSSTPLKAIYKVEKLRSLVMLRGLDFDMHEFIFNVTKNLTQLHALDLNSCNIEKFSDRINRLKHLRLLDLSCPNIITLPMSITRLYNLQTLNLHGCKKLQKLPEGISRLYNLQTLNLKYCNTLQELPEGISRLYNLRTLNIKYCNTLQELPEGIASLYNLRTLKLNGCVKLQKLPEGIASLYNLRTLKLNGCEKLQKLPEGISRLYNLQILNLACCEKLQELPENISNLINLRHLNIFYCNGLSCMPHGLGQLSNLQTLSTFIVSQEDGHTITELQHLNSIQGRLAIKDLQYVKDLNEAMQANLKAKTRLDSLQLLWEIGSNEAQEPSFTNVAEEVLERLQPHHNLKKLIIYDYMGSRLPSWISSSLSKLVNLYLSRLKMCDCLLPFGRLPSLKELTMDGMHAIKRIGEEFYGDDDSSAFPSLKALHLRDMLNLEEWDTEPMTAKRKIAIFPCLTRLIIRRCPKLTVQPCIPCSVEDLTIHNSNEMLLSSGSLAGLSKLKELSIDTYGVSLSSSSEWWDGLQCPTGVVELQIQPHDELTYFPEGIMYLPSLHTLSLISYKNLSSDWERRKQLQPIPFFTALRHLHITDVNQLTSLPEWIGGITSLHQLNIWDCPKLAMLPDGLRQLAALQGLFINNCPQLAKRCKRETGEDWHKIAHIPNINIRQ